MHFQFEHGTKRAISQDQQKHFGVLFERRRAADLFENVEIPFNVSLLNQSRTRVERMRKWSLIKPLEWARVRIRISIAKDRDTLSKSQLPFRHKLSVGRIVSNAWEWYLDSAWKFNHWMMGFEDDIGNANMNREFITMGKWLSFSCSFSDRNRTFRLYFRLLHSDRQ